MSDPLDAIQPEDAPSDPGVDLDSASMDPAQQSLAEALKITFRLLQLVMILLLVLFLGSGFQTVEESERGVKLVFGRVVQEDVKPGVTWNWPFPVGELVKVKTGQQQFELEDSFGPKVAEADRSRPLSQMIPRSYKLVPAQDGSLITGDGNIAHTWWRVIWRREQPEENTQNIYTPDEQEMVRRAVERGVVRAVAELSIDQLLKQGGSAGSASGAGETTLGLRARSVAQETLDAVKSGIRIEQLILSDKSPPGSVLVQFDLVSRAEAGAAKAQEDADKGAREILNGVAGESYSTLLALIESYERSLELGEREKAVATLAQINSFVEGEPLVVNGREQRASGRVTSIIAQARQYRTDMVASSQARAARFEAKLPTFKQNPQFFVASEWQPAYKAFTDSGQVETLLLAPDSALEVLLNRDPDVAADAERNRNKSEISTNLANLQAERDKANREVRDRAKLEEARKKGG